MKREIEEIIQEVRFFKDHGLSTLQAMAATLNEKEWDDLIDLIERLNDFYNDNACVAASIKRKYAK